MRSARLSPARLRGGRRPTTSRCSSPTESRSRMSRWPRLYSSMPGIAESASPLLSDTGTTIRFAVAIERRVPSDHQSTAASRLCLTEALEIPAHRIEEDEDDRQGEVDQESKRRADEGDRDRDWGDHGTDREPQPNFVDQPRVETRFNQTPISRYVPPNQVSQGRQQAKDRAVEAEGDWILGVRAHDRRGERDERDAHQKKDVQPHQGAIHAQDEVEHLVVGEPVDPEDDEADDERREPRPKVEQDLPQASRAERIGGAQLEHEDRHRDRKHAV